jgi:hypothetical protein
MAALFTGHTHDVLKRIHNELALTQFSSCVVHRQIYRLALSQPAPRSLRRNHKTL